MQSFTTVFELRAQIQQWKQDGLRIALVPTMGNLHAGHLSLVDLAYQYADKVVVSIFVNPKQFGPNEDFQTYPRTLEEDKVKLQSVAVEALFVPSVEEMYPYGLQHSCVAVDAQLTTILEGAERPGHFDGVTTIVAKLFNMVQPHLAVFGQKDYQQWLVLKTLANDLAFPVDMHMAPIARADDGLALSSRNQYLSAKQRSVAPTLYRTLQACGEAIKEGEHDYIQLSATAKQTLLEKGFDQVSYVLICDAQTLMPATAKTTNKMILAVAKLGKTRLLDNILL